MGTLIHHVACMIGIYKMRHSYQFSFCLWRVLWKIFLYLTIEVLPIIRRAFAMKVIIEWI